MKKRNFSQAETRINALLEIEPQNPDILYMQAVTLRYLKRFGAALHVLDEVQCITPFSGRIHQERGHLYRDQGRSREAIDAYRSAVQINPALKASWRGLAKLSDQVFDKETAAMANAQAERLESLPQELFAVENLIYENQVLKAEQICRTYLQRNPKDTEGMRLLADIGVRLGVLDDAEFLLESAVGLSPKNVQLRIDYIQVLRRRQNFARALSQARDLYTSDKDNPVFQSIFAIELMQSGDYEAAFPLFDAILAKRPNDPQTLVSRGHALKTVGRQDEAIRSYQTACEVAPELGEAWHALANLKTYEFMQLEIDRMERLKASGTLTPKDEIAIDFALGKAYEDRGDFDRSFMSYSAGNDLKRQQSNYRSDKMAEEFARQKVACTPGLFEKQAGHGCQARDPIFIVGLPRAGSTLLEQILASHSQVDGTLELPNILSLAHKLRGRERASGKHLYPESLHDLRAEELLAFGQAYIEETQIHRQGAPRFTDKMPNNFRHIGLIHLILPNAKIIDARREPMACCFSGFKQLFAEGQEFTYGLKEVGSYYREYIELMRHFDDVLPGKILRVIHEDVVADLEGQVRRLLEFCDLPFEQTCLDFHKTDRSVRTASSEQVRQPVSSTGLEQWKNFEKYLDPLRAALGPAQSEYRQ
ncbi:MAG: tetratricopeptide repeat protein [Alphaproteobacteria bacterium]|nr:MAG: tetratricopeptide repeat protein [Alphaproteobacteria bacterium]